MSEHPGIAECPSTDAICSVAAGLATDQEAGSLLLHASECEGCAAILARAAADFDRELDPEERGLAESVSLKVRPLPVPVRKPGRSWAWMAAAAALVILGGVSAWWTVWHGQQPEAEKLLVAASSHYRVDVWRLPDAGYSPIDQKRNGTGGGVPADLLKAEARLDAEGNGVLRGWAAVVRGRYGAALAELGSGNGGAEEYRWRLLRGIARGGSGEAADLRAAVTDFTRALELRPGDGAARFNRAWALWSLGEMDAARRDLAMLQGEGERAWAAEAERWIPPAPAR